MENNLVNSIMSANLNGFDKRLDDKNDALSNRKFVDPLHLSSFSLASLNQLAF